MIKQKNIRNFSERSALLLFIPIFLVSFLGSSFFVLPSPPVEAAIASAADAKKRAEAYCKKYGDAAKKEECLKSFVLGIRGLQVELRSDKVCGNFSKNGNRYEGCRAGFLEGLRMFKEDNPPDFDKSKAQPRAKAYCDSDKREGYSDADREACVLGYVEALSTRAVDYEFFCSGRDECIAGFLQGLREYQGDNEVKNPATPGNDNKAGATPDEAPDSNPDCDVTINPLTWIICPIIDLGANFTDLVFRNMVRPLLENIPIGTDPNDGGYRAWQGFRALGNIVLVGCLLAIVYAQARGDK